MKNIRRYFQDYAKYFPEEWDWNLSEDADSREKYMKFRARKGTLYRDTDKIPFFDSIEKDANQFGLHIIEFTDFFGIKWRGEKGRFRYVGDSDYEQHLYFVDPDESDDEESSISVSTEYTVSNPPKGFGLVERRGVKEFVDVANAVDIRYAYIVENHLFKDSCVTLSYDKPIAEEDTYGDLNDGAETTFDIHGIAKALRDLRPDLYKKFLESVQKHFEALQKSDREEERVYAPEKDGKFLTAEEYFNEYFSNEKDED